MKIGIVGAGNIGGTLGALWARAGHSILFGTRRPEGLKSLIAEIGAAADAGTPEAAAKFGDVLLFAAPYGAWPEFAGANREALAGKVVIDAANPYAERDGEIVADVKNQGIGA